ncbi:hypothetical protein GQ457_05G021810 [Hibiscus cannabinus]
MVQDKNNEESNKVQTKGIPRLDYEALIREIGHLIDRKLEPIHLRMDDIDTRSEGGRTILAQSNQIQVAQGGEIEQNVNDNEQPANNQPRPQPRRNVARLDDSFANIKMNIPPFHGKTDPEAYLERRNGERPVSTWDEMKAIMRKRFIPTHYHCELLRKLQNLTQDSMSVGDYFKEMELAMIRANIEEDQETTIASQNSKWGPNTSKTPYKAYQTPIKPSQTKGDVGISKSQQPLDMNRGKQTVTPSRNRDIQCFKCLGRGHIASQCPNRHTMVIRESGEIETDSEKEEEDDTIEDEVNENVDFPADREVLVVKRSLNTQVLGLETTKHPHSYKLQWLNDGGELKVTKQVLIPFSIGSYKDEVLCDVVPMHATHMLLGRP